MKVLILSSPSDNDAHIRRGSRASAELENKENIPTIKLCRHLRTRTCSMLKSKQQKSNINVDPSCKHKYSPQRPTSENIPLLPSDSTPSVRSKRSLSISGIGQLKKRR
jgi:hypothetical protein